MSPARQHRERLAAAAASAAPATPIASDAEGGQHAAFDVPMTPAREHRIVAAVAASTPAELLSATGTSGDRVSAEIALRLAHDLRRLKAIQSIEKKVEAKREMFGAYAAWCDAILAGDRANVRGVASEVLPTMMVWAIDIADWPRALELATHVVGCDVALPSRYQRTAPALVTEEIATAALNAQGSDEPFPLDVLEAASQLTGEADMHDEVRAKLMKAIGFELAREAEAATGTDDVIAAADRALVSLRRAHALHARVGAKDKIKRMERLIAAAAKVAKEEAAEAEKEAARQKAAAEAAANGAAEPAGEQSAATESTDTTEQAGEAPAA